MGRTESHGGQVFRGNAAAFEETLVTLEFHDAVASAVGRFVQSLSRTYGVELTFVGSSRLHDEMTVRAPFETDEEGAPDCVGDVSDGEYVHVLGGDPDALVAARNACESATEGAEAAGPVCSFDCSSRTTFLDDAFDDEPAAIGDADTPAFGAPSIGKIATAGEGHPESLNETVVLAHLEDG